MRARLLPSSLLLLALVLGPACGKKDGPGGPGASGSGTGGPAAATVQSDVATLVPNDTQVLLYVPSLDAAVTKARAVVASIDPDMAGGITTEALLQQAPAGAGAHVDPARPMAVALTFPAGQDEPVPTIIVGAKDAAKLSGAIEGAGLAKPHVAGSYVSITMGPSPAARGGSALVKSIPAGDLGLRADLASLYGRYRAEIDQALGSLPAPGAEAGGSANPLAPIVDAVRTALSSAESLDVALRLDGTRVDLDGELRVKEGSALVGKLEGSGDLAAYAGRLPKDFPLVVLASVDANAWMGWLEQLMKSMSEMMPPEQRESMLQSFRQSKELTPHFGRETAMGVGVGDQGVEFVTIRASKDGKTAVAKTVELMSAPSMAGQGVTFERLPATTVQGVEVSNLRMKFDFSKIAGDDAAALPPESMQAIEGVLGTVFGPEGLVLRNAAVDGVVVSYVGPPAFGDQAVSAAKKGGAAPAGVAESLRRAGGKPALLVHLEGRSLGKQVLGLVRKAMPPEQQADLPTIPDGRPATFSLHASGDGRVYRGGLSIEVGGWAELVKGLMGSMPR
jgi:hypothetical protein